MSSIYPRGEMLWMKFKNVDGKWECKSTGYRKGDETVALALASETERLATVERERLSAPMGSRVEPAHPETAATSRETMLVASPMEPIGSEAQAGALTVRDYGEQWLKRRTKKATAADEATRLRLHVFPLIGHMALADVRPRHVRDLVTAIEAKRSDAPKCKGEPLAPRTIRHVFSTLRLMFNGAVFDEVIAQSPVVLEPGVLPQNVDKDPEWRPTAIFDRAEVCTILWDRRIKEYRRVIYALEACAGLRAGEAEGLRVRDYLPASQLAPLGRITVSKSKDRKGTKTLVTRLVPVHPALAGILDEWLARGWRRKYGRPPTADDLLVPTMRMGVRRSSNTLKHFLSDLDRIGLRARRAHDLRRTFISLLIEDGANPKIVRPLTHPNTSDVYDLYQTYPWPTICAEVMKLKIERPELPPPASTREKSNPASVRNAVAGSFGYSPSYIASCSPENLSDSGADARVRTADLRFTKPLLCH